MSGGVDSSVSAYLLKKAGHDVTGVFIKVWQPDFLECTSREDRLDAMRVAAHLDIPFVTLDLEKEYKKGVIDYMIDEYKSGRTPNPDVMCNREVKFGAFWKWAKSQGADYIATGHYAQTNGVHLLNAVDTEKDQTYFLWKLTKEDLEHVLFPIGYLVKTEVRKIGLEAGLPVATKKDSQGLCFVGTIDVKEFLKTQIESSPGVVLDEEGQTIGAHEGAIFYTLGERHGFTVYSRSDSDVPHYVVSRDIEKNTITVSDHKPVIANGDEFVVESVSFVNSAENGFECNARGRYRAPLSKVQLCKEGNVWRVKKLEGDLIPVAGQSIVFYKDGHCLGGAVVA